MHRARSASSYADARERANDAVRRGHRHLVPGGEDEPDLGTESQSAFAIFLIDSKKESDRPLTELPATAQTIASSSIPGSSLKISMSTMSFLIVPETRAPARTAPRNSMIAAAMQACHSRREREETEVAKEFATSLAPGRMDR